MNNEITLTYRVAKSADAKEIALLHADSWRRTYRGILRDEFLDCDVVDNRHAIWHERLREERTNQFVLVAEEQHHIIGFICVYGSEDPQWGSLIDNLHVDYAYKRRGIGTSLMQRACVWLNKHYQELGVYLWVMEANHSARCFYDKLGSTNAGIFDKPNPAGGGSALLCRYVWSDPVCLQTAVNNR